jgi:hypothetical protein
MTSNSEVLPLVNAVGLSDIENQVSDWPNKWFPHPAGFVRIIISSQAMLGRRAQGSAPEPSSKESGRFTREHLRLAKSLALSAAVAIQNARLYERAEIYASELELQVKLLKETQAALEQTQSRSRGTGE